MVGVGEEEAAFGGGTRAVTDVGHEILRTDYDVPVACVSVQVMLQP